MNTFSVFLSMMIAAASGNWTVRDHLPVEQFVVQAHRGAGVLAPENCVAAFELGWKLNCVPEADVRMTSDGVIVAFHDNDFSRVVVNVTPELAKKGVKDVTFAEVERLDIGKGQRVQRLSEMFAAMSGKPERKMYLDIKQVDFDQLAKEVKAAGVESQVTLATPRYADIRKWRSLVPQSQTLLWMGGADDAAVEKKFDVARKAKFEGITQIQIHTHLKADLKSFDKATPDIFKESDAYLRARGDELRGQGILYQTLPYGERASDPAVYWRLLDLGFMSFATDHPDVTWDVVKQYYAGGKQEMSPALDAALKAARDTRRLELSRGANRSVTSIFREQFGEEAKAIVVADAQTMPIAGVGVVEALRAEQFVFDDPKLYAEWKFVEQLEPAIRAASDAIPVAIGAGTINDLVKLVAHRAGRPYLCVATAASMDGYTAYGASITKDGSKQTFDCPAPRAVIADIDVIAAAPNELTASGYADLLAKITAGADWMLADALGIEPIHDHAWRTVQGGLREAVADPPGVRCGEVGAITRLTEGLMMGGFAMQAIQSSRPASGAEHQFSHLWDMQHHLNPRTGEAPSHGFKVGIGTLAAARLYEKLFAEPIANLDVDAAVARWPSWEETQRSIDVLFTIPELRDKAIEESGAKHPSRGELRAQLAKLKSIWPELKRRLIGQLIPLSQLATMLRDAGAPSRCEDIGISAGRLGESHRLACHIRRRFTVLDLADRIGLLDG